MSHTDVRGRIEQRRWQRCTVKDCGLPVQKLGSLCSRHDATNERTGDPQGHTVRMREVRPYLQATTRYIRENREHPAIRAVLAYLHTMIYTKRPLVTHLRQNSTPRQRLDRWMARMAKQGVCADEVLAMTVAMFMIQEHAPSTFRSDRHFQHQVATRVLRMVRAPRVAVWRGGEGGHRYDRLTVRTRELLWQLIEGSVGLLALRVSKVLAVRFRPTSEDFLIDINEPLPEERS